MSVPASMAVDIRFRDAKLADAPAVAALIEALGYPCELGEAERRIRRVNASPRQALILAILGDSVCGLISVDYMFYLPLGRDTCRITALVVDARFRSQGVGRALLRHAESLARRENVARIELTTAGHRHEAHAFYTQCGYERSSVRFVKPLGDA
ncbi:GNAT family N-acetyltransferase [Ahniella affigens]|uniref:GNAT family N-acetyltransferase n=1 Tax=Ahniella affigens TaxID=2021234 RepID=A0A2P1PW09_9GAMM|nr:GNAT family N-acetyltransferase [Ahniella affigens]AVP99045.1 GNAT family N-acetyltransferase [Ahniella affigens]